ncbi:A/G-specific adenine glycosylase [Halosquirtibacter xylanolyticus]|uniref:A/G-specific adenine glycosylase n=1 Tax=Halosquirtibacter xylanolyticus TaxID=3374599 RepID=UPI0037485687|nr:A/G-specific adenine glycosylase [Prolixibacteraceae bacterium]
MEKIANLLILWFKEEKRVLPWRKNRSPYRVWVSEIILQQTKVAQGKAYFERFMELFPNIKSLASAEQKEVLKAWEGLGYYSRARNLHEAANQVMVRHDCIFPKTHKEILALKGIGSYTAGAILSFSWDMPYPAIDGNTIRVISRLFGINSYSHLTSTHKQIAELIIELYIYGRPKIINEAIIELGALVCSPKNPNCSACPINSYCIAKKENTINALPRVKKKSQPSERVLHFILLHGPKDTIYIEERKKDDIWKGLYTPLLIEGAEKFASSKEILRFTEKKNINIESLEQFDTIIHKLTHQTLHIIIWNAYTLDQSSHFIAKSDLLNFPTPKPFMSFFKKYSE